MSFFSHLLTYISHIFFPISGDDDIQNANYHPQKRSCLQG